MSDLLTEEEWNRIHQQELENFSRDFKSYSDVIALTPNDMSNISYFCTDTWFIFVEDRLTFTTIAVSDELTIWEESQIFPYSTLCKDFKGELQLELLSTILTNVSVAFIKRMLEYSRITNFTVLKRELLTYKHSLQELMKIEILR